ncbi:MAG: hypothetical protein RIG62_14655 [Cyclobacteriaceae bacterium]
MKLFSQLTLAVVTASFFLAASCTDDPCEIDPSNCQPDDEIVGQKGNPQFNLQFTGEVDLDLYVEDPAGNIIFWENSYSSSGGQLDVDCECSNCPNGPNENIFWPTDGSAPQGTYRYWIEYYGSCDFSSSSASYTVHVLENGSVVDTHTGNLSSSQTSVWTYTH